MVFVTLFAFCYIIYLMLNCTQAKRGGYLRIVCKCGQTHGQFANVRQMAEKRHFRRSDFIGGG